MITPTTRTTGDLDILLLGIRRRRAGYSELIPAGIRHPREYFHAYVEDADDPVLIVVTITITETNIAAAHVKLYGLLKTRPAGWRADVLNERQYIDAATCYIHWLRARLVRLNTKPTQEK